MLPHRSAPSGTRTLAAAVVPFGSISGMQHALGAPVQVKPCSIWQVALHPSAPAMLPSSQASEAATIPSPHTAVHTLGDPPQEKPVSIWQTLLQPSPSAPLPSSHPSEPATAPSPQPGVH